MSKLLASKICIILGFATINIIAGCTHLLMVKKGDRACTEPQVYIQYISAGKSSEVAECKKNYGENADQCAIPTCIEFKNGNQQLIPQPFKSANKPAVEHKTNNILSDKVIEEIKVEDKPDNKPINVDDGISYSQPNEIAQTENKSLKQILIDKYSDKNRPLYLETEILSLIFSLIALVYSIYRLSASVMKRQSGLCAVMLLFLIYLTYVMSSSSFILGMTQMNLFFAALFMPFFEKKKERYDTEKCIKSMSIIIIIIALMLLSLYLFNQFNPGAFWQLCASTLAIISSLILIIKNKINPAYLKNTTSCNNILFGALLIAIIVGYSCYELKGGVRLNANNLANIIFQSEIMLSLLFFSMISDFQEKDSKDSDYKPKENKAESNKSKENQIEDDIAESNEIEDNKSKENQAKDDIAKSNETEDNKSKENQIEDDIAKSNEVEGNKSKEIQTKDDIAKSNETEDKKSKVNQTEDDIAESNEAENNKLEVNKTEANINEENKVNKNDDR